MLEKALSYAHARHEHYLARFQELLSIPSVSTDSGYREDVRRCAGWIVEELARIGFDNCRAYETPVHPVVYGEWLKAGSDAPAVLVYAHYDVQPVDPLALWDSPPFTPTIREGNLYARGAIDDKAGVYTNLAAFEALLKTAGRLPVNIKVFFEGEEESGSAGSIPFVADNHELLAADLVVISDGGNLRDQPLVITSTRGIVDFEVAVRGPQRDLHSGLFGGIVENPAHVVGRIIEALHDNEGRIRVPGYYDQLQPLTDAEREIMARQEAIFRSQLEQDAGVPFWGERLGPLVERATALPTLDVNGVWGGYQGEGGKTVIPAEAGFKASTRLAPGQDPEQIVEALRAFIMGFASETARITFTHGPVSCPAALLSEGPVIEAIHQAFEATWGKRALLYRQGGSVPIIGTFKQELGLPITSLGFGDGSNGHSPNEYIILEHFFRNIDTAIHFYCALADKMSAAELER
jgi:acetylornithine deacetylase/succinyl-diaminopimelate desuccinylase-like protein